MSSTIAKHAKALTKVRKSGIAVTFNITTPGTYDETTDTHGEPIDSTVVGYAVEIPGVPEDYELFELVPSETVSLFFVPTTIGQEPVLNSAVTWAGSIRTVKAIQPIRPDGTFIAGRIFVVSS